jgi:single-stranded DNA-specific DHH superfamily exonuclease
VTTLFMIVMGIGDVSANQLDITTMLQFVALGAIGDLITGAGAIAIYLNVVG